MAINWGAVPDWLAGSAAVRALFWAAEGCYRNGSCRASVRARSMETHSDLHRGSGP